MASAASQALRDEPGWPGASAPYPRVVFLIDASSALERRLLSAWIERHAPDGADAADIEIPPSRRRAGLGRTSLGELEGCLAAEGDVLLAPLRIAWLPKKRNGKRAARFSDLLRLGDPRDPGSLRAALVLRREPDRCRIVAGEPARRPSCATAGASRRVRLGRDRAASPSSSPARPRWPSSGPSAAARRALQGAAARRRGHPRPPGLSRRPRAARPRRGPPARRGSPGTPRATCARSPPPTALRDRPGRPAHPAALHPRLRRALHYDRERADAISALAQRHPVVFLPTHKSNLDHLVLQYALHENGMPPNHTAGGINMNFFPVGPLVRRSGVFFIRRSFKDNPVYKFVLHHYIDYLIEKRFSLEWYIEGGRSRSGKLLPPRFGLLAYVVDAYRRGKSDDVMLIPVSIAYDQITDVGDYAAEQRGGAKQTESFGWFVGIVRRLARATATSTSASASPLSLREEPRAARPRRSAEPDERELALQKLAFEVCVRINRATPITPTSLVTLALLGAGERASPSPRRGALANLLAYVRDARLPTTGELDLDTDEGVERTSTPWSRTASSRASTRDPRRSTRSATISSSPPPTTATRSSTSSSTRRSPSSRCCAPPRTTCRSRRRVLGRGDAAARPPEVRVLLRGQGDLPRRAARELADRTRDWEATSRPGPTRSRTCCASSVPSARTACCGPSSRPTGSSADQLERQDRRRSVDEARFLQACWGSASSTTSSGASDHRVGLEGAVQDRPQASPTTASCSQPGEPDLAGWRAAFAAEFANRRPPHRGHRRPGGEPARRTHRLRRPAAQAAPTCSEIRRQEPACLPGLGDGVDQDEEQDGRHDEAQQSSPEGEPANPSAPALTSPSGPHAPSDEEGEDQAATQQEEVVRDLVHQAEHVESPARRAAPRSVIAPPASQSRPPRPADPSIADATTTSRSEIAEVSAPTTRAAKKSAPTPRPMPPISAKAWGSVMKSAPTVLLPRHLPRDRARRSAGTPRGPPRTRPRRPRRR